MLLGLSLLMLIGICDGFYNCNNNKYQENKRLLKLMRKNTQQWIFDDKNTILNSTIIADGLSTHNGKIDVVVNYVMEHKCNSSKDPVKIIFENAYYKNQSLERVYSRFVSRCSGINSCNYNDPSSGLSVFLGYNFKTTDGSSILVRKWKNIHVCLSKGQFEKNGPTAGEKLQMIGFTWEQWYALSPIDRMIYSIEIRKLFHEYHQLKEFITSLNRTKLNGIK